MSRSILEGLPLSAAPDDSSSLQNCAMLCATRGPGVHEQQSAEMMYWKVYIGIHRFIMIEYCNKMAF
jgi:hypothetical protein